MSIFKKTDVKNHLSLRFRARTYLNTSVGQTAATYILGAEPDATGRNPSPFTEDYSAEHTSAGPSPIVLANSTGSTDSQEPETSKSAQA
jgi:hypothetical protein